MPRNHSSTGCQRCVQRKVKCDETKPACRECLRRNLGCPGYPVKYVFYNVHTWNTEGPHRRVKGVRTYRPGSSKLVPTSMDNRVMPSLATESARTQELVIFSRYVEADYSGLWACYAPRLEPNWLDFVMHPARPPPTFLRLAVRALAILHLGQTENPSFVAESMDAYGDALASQIKATRCLPILSDNTLADQTLASALMLAVYEMKNGSSRASWVGITNSIANVMQATGNPSATYASGFGRTLFVIVRPLLLRAALACGHACFLERAEWISAVQGMVRLDDCNGRGSDFGTWKENAYIEIVKVPGLATCTYALNLESEDTGLTDATTQCRDRLADIQREMERILTALSGCEADTPAARHYLGPIPFQSALEIIWRALDGIQATLTLLERLLRHQTVHHLARQHYLGLTPECRAVIFPAYRTREEFGAHLRAAYDALPDIGWLDYCSLTMGMVPSRDVLVFPWQYRVCGGQMTYGGRELQDMDGL